MNLLAPGHLVTRRTVHAGSPSRRRLLLTVAASALIALGLAACGDSDSDAVATSPTSSTTEKAAEYGGTGGGTGGENSSAAEVLAEDFSLTSATVAPGAEVTFSNEGQAPHTMTADDGSFDTDRVAPGSTAKVTAPDEPGSYAFHCTIHPSMTGTLTVTG